MASVLCSLYSVPPHISLLRVGNTCFDHLKPQSVIPEDAMVGAWTKSAHRLWVKRLRCTSSLVELLQVVTDFVAAIKEDWPCECHVAEGSDTVMQEIIACFPNMCQTSSAFALWLMKLDSLIAPSMEKARSLKNQETLSKSTEYTLVLSSTDLPFVYFCPQCGI
ncbi:hypothetical protein HS088_TW22G00195 [Tripterygium wilfordii]|uniref:Uncharacterized protein n=1 Tax=Tripterygium wilfordii TaxID=458696 RepID=A0A7J7BY21_TRIWF|nr:hypothetical protein HS088_TW22G00195 [Tripterygium wilfordii]